MATLCLADGLINAKNYAEAESILKNTFLFNKNNCIYNINSSYYGNVRNN